MSLMSLFALMDEAHEYVTGYLISPKTHYKGFQFNL